MDDLIHCSKCESIPYDVLMMNCKHNLCIKCAVERVQSQKSVVGRQYIQCEKCKARTNLDEQSVQQLQKAQKTKNYIQKIYIEKQGQKRNQTPINTGRQKNLPKKQQLGNQIKVQEPNQNAKKQPSKSPQKQRVKQEEAKSKSSLQKQKQKIEKQTIPVSHSQMANSHVQQLNYGECQIHREEPVMYYCLTCKIHCFCAQCVLLGKHNKHDVKVIKKAYISVEKQFHSAIAVTKKFVQELFEHNRNAADSINAVKNRADSLKRTIEKAFDEVRAILRQKQLQFMKMVDQKLLKTMETNNGIIKKTVQVKLREQQDMLGRLQTTMKKGEKSVLHFYSDEWGKVQQVLKNQSIKLPASESSFGGILTDYIAAVKKQVEKVQIKAFQH